MNFLKQLAKQALLYFVVLYLVSFFCVAVVANSPYKRISTAHADYAIVLGAAINSPALRHRVSTAAELAAKNQVDNIIFTGGKTSEPDITEAHWMYKYYSKNFASNTVLIEEGNAQNTWENLEFSSHLLSPTTTSIVIVSDSYHLLRALLISKSLGLPLTHVQSPDNTYYRGGKMLYYYGREALAIIYYIPRLLRL
jgi:uncharacterized SAM-binding protein YcdF (DUF218 family)